MTTEQMIEELFIVAGKHKNDVVGVGELNIHAMCIDVAQRLKELSEQTNVGKWIPCSDRLPKKDDFQEQRNRILASCSDGIVRNATIKSLLNSEKHISRGNEFTYIAWQPLPEPYKPEKASTATQTWADAVMRTFLGRNT